MSEYTTSSATATREGSSSSGTPSSPVVAMGTELYKNLTMSADAVLHLLPKVSDERIKTALSASLCFYEKQAGKVKALLEDAWEEIPEEGRLSKLMAHAGITMNTLLDATDSHLAQMIIEGSTMSITEATKLCHRYEEIGECRPLCRVAENIVEFEQGNIDHIKQFL